MQNICGGEGRLRNRCDGSCKHGGGAVDGERSGVLPTLLDSDGDSQVILRADDGRFAEASVGRRYGGVSAIVAA